MFKMELLTLWKLAVFPFILDCISILIMQINIFPAVKIHDTLRDLIEFT